LIDVGQLVRAIVVFATKQCLFRAVSTTRIEALREGWVEAQEGLRFAINFLKANAGIEDESLLSSPMFIHTLAAFSRVKDNKITKVENGRCCNGSWLPMRAAVIHVAPLRRCSTKT